jgi:hypothetical protein
MAEPIEVLSVADAIDPARPQATRDAAGVRGAQTYLRAGSYQRPPPRAIDVAELAPEWRAELRGYLDGEQQAYPPALLLQLGDARLVGQGSVVTRDRQLVRETALEFLGQGLAPTGFAFAAGGQLVLPDAPEQTVTTPSLLLKRPWYKSFRHWLTDCAAPLALAGRMRLPAGWQIIVGTPGSPRLREIVTATLAMLAPGVPVVEHPDEENWTVSDLFVPTPLQVPPLFKHPEGMACLRAVVLRGLLALRPPARPTRLFVLRSSAGGVGVLDNEAELGELARARGYEVLQPERVGFAKQAQLFREAQSVVGVKGTVLTNLLFCTSGASALLLSPGDFPDPFYWDLAAHAGVAYAELFGRLTARDQPRSHNPFRIDPARFLALLPA